VVKSLLKLLAAALVANATWHVFVAYSAHYKFRDAVESAAQFGVSQSEAQLGARVVELAAQYDVPAVPGTFMVRRANKHTLIEGSYTRPVDLFPGFSYPWSFSWSVDTFTF
jgi:hypothetical protein